jgi:hypothetical protein
MTRFFAYTAIVIALGTTATLAIHPSAANPSTSSEALFAADGPFRDGLYLGKLAAEQGQARRLTVGRWSTEHARSMFSEGYRRGYEQGVAATPSTQSTN